MADPLVSLSMPAMVGTFAGFFEPPDDDPNESCGAILKLLCVNYNVFERDIGCSMVDPRSSLSRGLLGVELLSGGNGTEAYFVIGAGPDSMSLTMSSIVFKCLMGSGSSLSSSPTVPSSS